MMFQFIVSLKKRCFNLSLHRKNDAPVYRFIEKTMFQSIASPKKTNPHLNGLPLLRRFFVMAVSVNRFSEFDEQQHTDTQRQDDGPLID